MLLQAGVQEKALRLDSLEIVEPEHAAMIRLHALPGAAIPGESLPRQVSQVAGQDPVRQCLRPTEWLIISDQLDAASLLASTRQEFPAPEFSALDHSDGLARLRLSGPAAAWLLNKISGVDFTTITGSSQPQCLQTRLGHVRAVVYVHAAADKQQTTFDLIVDHSLARYLWELLGNSAAHAEALHARWPRPR